MLKPDAHKFYARCITLDEMCPKRASLVESVNAVVGLSNCIRRLTTLDTADEMHPPAFEAGTSGVLGAPLPAL